MTVHSGLKKVKGCKSYHPYFSDTKIHYYLFVKIAVKEMVTEVENLDNFDSIIIESGNGRCQHKSAQHFYDIQQLAHKLEKSIIRIYGVEGHGKRSVRYC